MHRPDMGGLNIRDYQIFTTFHADVFAVGCLHFHVIVDTAGIQIDVAVVGINREIAAVTLNRSLLLIVKF